MIFQPQVVCSAYMPKKTKFKIKSKHKFKYNKWALFSLFISIALFIVTYSVWASTQSNSKIYSIEDVIKFPKFSIKISNVQVKQVDLPIIKSVVDKYGPVETFENCDMFSEANRDIWSYTAQVKNPYGPSERAMCVRRNNSRNEILKYSKNNKQLVIDYKISANETVDTALLNVALYPDSGRDPNLRVNEFNGNEFMIETYEYIKDKLFFNYQTFNYTPYFISDIGLDINKGIKRDAFVFTDVNTTESTLDIIFRYNEDIRTHKRIVRVNLK